LNGLLRIEEKGGEKKKSAKRGKGKKWPDFLPTEERRK